jgi:signal transduction histidine kinase
MSFRRRLMTASVLSVALVALLMAAATYVAARSLIFRQLDDGLRSAAAVPLPDVMYGPGPGGAVGTRLSAPVRMQLPDSPAQAPVIFTRVLQAGQRAAGGATHLPAALAGLKPGRSRTVTTHVGGKTVRILASARGDGRTVVVGAPIDSQLHTLRILLGVLAGLVVVATAVGALGARLASRRTLAPVRELTGAAEEIAATRDLAHRVRVADGDDELGRMASAFNTMLDALERSQAAQRRLVADASHELRTPLTALRGNAAYIAQHGANAEVLSDLESDARRLARLLDDLLALAREDAAGPSSSEPVRLDRLALASASPRIEVDAPSPVTVRGDADALARAIANLVENALVHGPADEVVRIQVREEAGRARLTVTDRGAGLSPEQAEHAFERFWRAPIADAPAGSGLGLAIVRATAERHGGSVSVAGATFTLELPSIA